MRFMDWVRSRGHADRRAPFSPPVPQGRRRDDYELHLKMWIDEMEQHVGEIEAAVQSLHEVTEGR